MAATAWAFFNKAKKQLSQNSNGIRLDGTGKFKLSLHTSASDLNTSASARVLSTMTGIGGEITAQGGYAAGGRTLAGIAWTLIGDPGSVKWDATDLVFTANGANLSNIKFAVIHLSNTSVTSGYPICWSKLSTSQFSVTSGNTLTIQFAAAGIFTLT
jgi:hypothetical protein